MFQLKLSSTDLTHGTIALTWCLDQEVLKELAERKIVNPQVVISISPEGSYNKYKEQRFIVPLKDLMTYVSFNCKGKNNIFGFISSLYDEKETKNRYFDKGNYSYSEDIISYYNDEYSSILISKYENQNDIRSKQYKFISTLLSVEVPENSFAKEPFDKKWINYYLKSKANNQCDFRKKRFFGYLIQPIIMIGDLLLRLFMIVLALSIGARNFSFKYLNPLEYVLSNTGMLFKGGSIFISNNKSEKMSDFAVVNIWRKAKYIFFMPLILIPLILALIYSAPLVFGLLCFLIILFLTLTIGELFVGSSQLGRRWIKSLYFNWCRFLSIDMKEQDLWYLNQDEIDLVVCSDKDPLNYNSIPQKKKTVRLQYLNLKSKVCKPFSK